MSEENKSNTNTNTSSETSHSIEKLEEAKFKARYPHSGFSNNAPGRGILGHSAFLQKRLAKGQKYFDSGDYQMAKQNNGGELSNETFKVPAIPTPDSVPARKTSNIQTSKFS